MEMNNKLQTVDKLEIGKYYQVLYRNWNINNWSNPIKIKYLGKFLGRNQHIANIFNNILEFNKDNESYTFFHSAINMYQEVDIIDRFIHIVI